MVQPLPKARPYPQEMAVAPDLAPCPFCGSSDLHFSRWHPGGTAFVMCRSCHAEGPYFGADDGTDDDKAVTAWNTRHKECTTPTDVGRASIEAARRILAGLGEAVDPSSEPPLDHRLELVARQVERVLADVKVTP